MKNLWYTFIIAVLLLCSTFLQASVMKVIDLRYDFPEQPARTNVEIIVQLHMTSFQPWLSGEVILEVSPYTHHITDMDPDCTPSVPDRIPFKAGEDNTKVDIPVSVSAKGCNGEYDIRAQVRLKTEQGERVRSRTFSILAEEGELWFGNDSIDNSIRSKLQNLFSKGHFKPGESSEDAFEQEMHERGNKIYQRQLKKDDRSFKVTP